jgi:hypothetical protein
MRTRTNLLRSIAIVGVLASTVAGCGKIAEKASEEAVEQAIESEGGEDVEIDFSDDGLTVESQEGDLTFTADEDGVQIDGTDAEGNDFSLDGDESGIEIESEDGNGSLDIDDDGTFTVTDENGEVVTGEVDSDGETVEFSVDGENGDDASFSTSEGIPDEWPSDVPEPEGLEEVSGSFFSDGTDETVLVTGKADSDANGFFDDYVARLLDDGFTEQSMYSQPEIVNGSYIRGDLTVTVSAENIDGAGTEVVIAVA